MRHAYRPCNILITLLLIALSGCGAAPSDDRQSTLEQIADSLQVTFSVTENRGNGGCTQSENSQPCHRANIALQSPKAFDLQNWAIYFSSIAPLDKVVGGEFTVEPVKGDLYRIQPAPQYQPFTPGETKVIDLVFKGISLSEVRILPNYYITAEALEPRVIASTQLDTDPESGLEDRPYADSIDLEQAFVRAEGDVIPLSDSQYLYARNQALTLTDTDLDTAIIPSPRQLTRTEPAAQLDLSQGIQLLSEGIDNYSIAFALSQLQALGLEQKPGGVPLRLKQDSGQFSEKEAYSLTIDANGIHLVAADPAGASHGLLSVAALLMPGETTLPHLHISDAPRYPFRGLHVDVSRNFYSKAFILTLLDQMAAYKLNKLHLHLGDDEGWRLEIDGLPELTSIGSKRCHDLSEDNCLLPQLGSGPTPHPTRDGYYSKADYQDILQAASERHIQVIPSFDMPGHSRAAVKSMEARYRRFMAEGNEEKATEYLLSDLNDTTEYLSIQFYNDNTINVCMESAYRFIDKVIDEVQKIHAQANHPLTRYHIGADETAGAWVDSPICQAYLQQQ
ncbi:MAG: carbohydate-binding domain-containing protein, partial [Porticoccaceae bacterium]|nr:carbohydate-binding domain-containing protein [Porticoccaceae bacterium]